MSSEEAWYDQCTSSLSKKAEEQAQSNQGLEGEKVMIKYGMYALVPEFMTSLTAVAARLGTWTESNNHSMENPLDDVEYEG